MTGSKLVRSMSILVVGVSASATSMAALSNSEGKYEGFLGSGTQVIYEYYNAALDRYFMTGMQPDIDALDSGRIPGWTRTGQVLIAPTDASVKTDVRLDPIEINVPSLGSPAGRDVHLDPIEWVVPSLPTGYAPGSPPRYLGPPTSVATGPELPPRYLGPPTSVAAGPELPARYLGPPTREGPPSAPWSMSELGAVPVCRYLFPSGSHFFSASAAECDIVASVQGVVLEASNAFLAWMPQPASGACPTLPEGALNAPLVPVYRVSNAQDSDNQRLTTGPLTRDAMLKAGWVADGYGSEGVAMCMLPAASLR